MMMTLLWIDALLLLMMMPTMFFYYWMTLILVGHCCVICEHLIYEMNWAVQPPVILGVDDCWTVVEAVEILMRPERDRRRDPYYLVCALICKFWRDVDR